MSIAAVVLAAGASTRLGRPKQTVTLNSETLLARAVRTAQKAGCSPIIVVVRAGASLPLADCITVENFAADEGLASSIRCGIETALQMSAEGAVVMTCDQPAVTATHLRALTIDSAVIRGSLYAGRIGVPAYFPAVSFPALLMLRGDTGARELLAGALAIRNELLSLDVDTENDLRQARSFYEGDV